MSVILLVSIISIFYIGLECKDKFFLQCAKYLEIYLRFEGFTCEGQTAVKAFLDRRGRSP